MSRWDPSRWISDSDRIRSRTAHSLDDLRRAVEFMKGRPTNRMLDIGCGYGGLPALVGDYLGVEEVHGIDIDGRVEQEATSKGVDLVLLDAGANPLPYPDEHFDIVMSLGMMDYLVTFDGLIRQINRVTVPGGQVLVTLPNLASWHNRISLLLGYQPRDVEISNELLAGVTAGYRNEKPAGHIHIPTLRAFSDLMQYHGFEASHIIGGRPRQRAVARPLFAVDAVMARVPSLARRFYFVGTKVADSPVPGERLDYPDQSLG